MGIYYVSGVPFGDELYHHGIKGQKWGVRRYQNEDGSLTEAGKKRYLEAFSEANHEYHNKWESEDLNANPGNPRSKVKNRVDSIAEKHMTGQNYREKQAKTDTLLEARQKQSILSGLFGETKLDKAYREASKISSDAADKVIKNTLLETYDYVEKLPKKDRAAAMAYVYEKLGLDW